MTARAAARAVAGSLHLERNGPAKPAAAAHLRAGAPAWADAAEVSMWRSFQRLAFLAFLTCGLRRGPAGRRGASIVSQDNPRATNDGPAHLRESGSPCGCIIRVFPFLFLGRPIQY